MTAKRIKVTFSDACTDVLVYLAEQPADVWWTWHGIRDAVAPEDADDPSGTVLNAMRTLRECGLIEGRSADGFPGWRITGEGRAAVARGYPQDAKGGFPALGEQPVTAPGRPGEPHHGVRSRA